MKKYNEQEAFWCGDFGNEYIKRNQGVHLVAGKVNMFSNILAHADRPSNILELGTNVGLNLKAIRTLLPDSILSGVEINHMAAEECRKIGNVEVFEESLLQFKSEKKWDFVFTSGVLIHIHPDYLQQAYDALYEHSKRYICVVEYYNPTPVEVEYRGHQGKLFKRDFAGEIMDRYPDLKLVHYGFGYHRDKAFPCGDATWFLMEK